MATDIIIKWIRTIAYTFFLAFTINVIWAVLSITLMQDFLYGYGIINGGIPFTWMYAYIYQYSIHYDHAALLIDLLFWMLLILLLWTYKGKIFKPKTKISKKQELTK